MSYTFLTPTYCLSFPLRVPFNISYRAGIVVMNSCICLGNSLSLLLFWMIALLVKVFLTAGFFFQHFEYIMQSFCEKAADSLTGFPLGVTIVFSLAAFKILSLLLLFAILISMCLCGTSLGWFCWGLSIPVGSGFLFPSGSIQLLLLQINFLPPVFPLFFSGIPIIQVELLSSLSPFSFFITIFSLSYELDCFPLLCPLGH